MQIKLLMNFSSYFFNVVTVPLNYEKIELHPERASNIKPFINKYNWRGINYPSKIDDWKTFEKDNQTIAQTIFYILKKKYEKDNQTIAQTIFYILKKKYKTCLYFKT